MNGYFQLQIKNEGIFVKVYPPSGQGVPLDVKELMDYLDMRQLDHYNLKELNAATQSKDQAQEVYVAPHADIFVNEMMVVNVSLDKMRVDCRFYPPSNGGNWMDEEEILQDLKANKVQYGIDRGAISEFLRKREYCKDYTFALGRAPIHGKDARIEYFFNTNPNLKPKRNDDGSVDYHNLNTIGHVHQGDLLARLIPEEEGTPGTDVYGKEIAPRKVRKRVLEFANNIRPNEDCSEIYSEVTGHASLVNGKVFVSDVFEVPADVDNSIGNVDYTGNVHVVGNVKGGFSVKARGDIVVDGVVEDAELEAGGQIIVKRGIHGKGKGSLVAGGNILCKFIESAFVSAGGFIETDCILHSRVSAYSEIHVLGKKGFITGGVIRAGALVEAQTIGSEMGSDTRVEVGSDPRKKERMLSLKETISTESEELAKIKTVLANYTRRLQAGEELPPDKLRYVQKLARQYKEKKAELEPLQEKYSKLQKEMMIARGAKIQVRKTIYSGVRIAVSDLEMRIKSEQSFCQYMKKDGEIARMAL